MKAEMPYVLLCLAGVFMGSVSQVLLKKAALRPHKSIIQEYLDWRVILGYCIFLLCTLCSMFAYRGIPLNLGPVLETTGYVYVTIFGVTIFHERITRQKLLALGLILVGIIIFAL